MQEMISRGVYCVGGWYICYTHTQQDVDNILAATDETFEVVLKYAGEVKSKEVVDGESKQKTDATKTETAEETEAELAQAALNNVQVDDSADLNANKDAKDSDTEWLSMAGMESPKMANQNSSQGLDHDDGSRRPWSGQPEC